MLLPKNGNTKTKAPIILAIANSTTNPIFSSDFLAAPTYDFTFSTILAVGINVTVFHAGYHWQIPFRQKSPRISGFLILRKVEENFAG